MQPFRTRRRSRSGGAFVRHHFVRRTKAVRCVLGRSVSVLVHVEVRHLANISIHSLGLTPIE